jgi:LysM repeat protein
MGGKIQEIRAQECAMTAGYNLSMIRSQIGKIIMIILTGLLSINLVGCASEQNHPSPEIIPNFELTPYWTSTVVPKIESATPELSFTTPTLSRTPTPTPIMYTIAKGDTMLGVALKYGLTLEEIRNANPDVDPRFLSVGTTLVIPLGDILPAEIPTPTPLAVQLGQIECYQTADGGEWCVVPVRNTRNRSIENLSARIMLFTQTGEVIAEGVATAPLNILREAETIALSIYFPGPFDQDVIPQANLLTALAVTQEGDRYLKLNVEVDEVDIPESGQQAYIFGSLSLAKKSMPASRIWLVGMAYDFEGDVIGVRKWEAANNLEPGKSMPFEITVFSIGPPIEKVEILAEARP